MNLEKTVTENEAICTWLGWTRATVFDLSYWSDPALGDMMGTPDFTDWESVGLIVPRFIQLGYESVVLHAHPKFDCINAQFYPRDTRSLVEGEGQTIPQAIRACALKAAWDALKETGV